MKKTLAVALLATIVGGAFAIPENPGKTNSPLANGIMKYVLAMCRDGNTRLTENPGPKITGFSITVVKKDGGKPIISTPFVLNVSGPEQARIEVENEEEVTAKVESFVRGLTLDEISQISVGINYDDGSYSPSFVVMSAQNKTNTNTLSKKADKKLSWWKKTFPGNCGWVDCHGQ